MSSHELQAVGSVARRKDGVAKVTGAEEYTPDIALPRMWYARVLRSPYAHANITSIDTSSAEALGAVCLTFAEVPKVKYNVQLTRRDDKDVDFIIPDNREGWVELLRRTLDAFFVAGKSFTYSTTLGTSTMPPMLMPQWQTNTPTRGSSSLTSRSGG